MGLFVHIIRILTSDRESSESAVDLGKETCQREVDEYQFISLLRALGLVAFLEICPCFAFASGSQSVSD